MNIDQETLRSVVEKVMADLGRTASSADPIPAKAAVRAPSPTPSPSPASAEKECTCPSAAGSGQRSHGVFDCVNIAVNAAHDAFLELKNLGLEGRSRVIEIVKGVCSANTESWGAFELNETKIGRLDHKIAKLEIMNKVPGVEWLRPYALSGDDGITLEEYAPFGVVGAILPVTHSVPTMTGNVINMVAAGNAVVAKPAEATPLIALRATEILHEAGVPKTALQTLPGDGHIVGAALTSDSRVGGIVFTGSTATAQSISRSVAHHLDPAAPLVAETGGINAMIVDSSALAEQVVADVIASAFDSAGQRCSALRVLYVQNDIADTLLTMLSGAMAELSIGDGLVRMSVGLEDVQDLVEDIEAALSAI